MDGPRVNGGTGGGSGGGGADDGQDPTHNIEKLTEKAVEEQHKESAAGTDYKGESSAGAAVPVQVRELSTADTTEATTNSKVNRKKFGRYEQYSELYRVSTDLVVKAADREPNGPNNSYFV